MENSAPPQQLSALVVTHERPQLLRNLLQSLVEVGRHRWASVVVVDDSKTPGHLGDLHAELPLRHLVLPHRVFVTRAKNIGLAEISSPYVLIIDDDNVVTGSSIDRPLRRLATERRLAAVMPSVLYRGAPDLVWVYATPFRSDRWGFQLLGRNRPRDPRLEGRAHPTDALPNAAFFRTEALRQVGGYDEGFTVNSSADLCQRLKRAGWLVEADAGSFVHHDVELPGRPGYWAAHTSTDPERTYHETIDWFRLERGIHSGEPALVARLLYHSIGWIAPLLVALAIRPGANRLRTLGAVVKGLRDGLGSVRD